MNYKNYLSLISIVFILVLFWFFNSIPKINQQSLEPQWTAIAPLISPNVYQNLELEPI